ncbi:hypothetical protein [Nitrosomonas ureae]|uniref:hypothetical protein n=1 Tax=Nitrosomonas ureae TaxID=44577 RepID=UPI000BE3903C
MQEQHVVDGLSQFHVITDFGIHQGVAGCFSFQYSNSILMDDTGQIEIGLPLILGKVEIKTESLRRDARNITIVF